MDGDRWHGRLPAPPTRLIGREREVAAAPRGLPAHILLLIVK